MTHKSIIIGAGFAGFTAAVYLARAGLKPLVIKGQSPSYHVTTTMEIEYFPGFLHGIQGPELLDNMFKQAEEFGAVVKIGDVTRIDVAKRPFKVWLEGWGELQTNTLIIASGTTAKLLGIPGEKDHLGLGVSTCAPCSGFFFRNKKVIVVGGGDSAMEEAIYLSHYASEISIVNRSDQPRASLALMNRAREITKINWLMNRTPIEVLAGEKGIKGLKVTNTVTGQEENLAAEGVFVAVGSKPNTEFLANQLPIDKHGYLKVKPGTTETDIPGIFACGDVQDRRYRQILNAIGSGCMAAIDCQRFLTST
ncbi:FAD-dependent oxidoreductase [Paenibacillus sp. SYP-B3998]|uniref:FAD-dependent oxidoreductase n=1 Tax=Paenibacillus sp. SYP-B3998 TaxID=2678564 RepID=A0A6G4A1X0_9BACL|nr:FAD-dependent oxidoreductase [Paenibacillus sp. SYP-B3998]NEW08382.1 FAD-dependent oxidoreductase [Paenibacillus sp. SYP-B3998]